MTQERASEIIRAMAVSTEDERGRQYDLFAHFWDFFKLNERTGTQFAEWCGFPIGKV